MFVVIVEQCISAERKGVGKTPVEDWYALVALALPFEARVGTELCTKANKVIELTRVIYNPSNVSFWAELESILHPKPDAETVAKALVDKDGWDVAVTKGDLEKAIKELHEKAVKKLQQSIMKAQAAMGLTRNIIDPSRISGYRTPRKH